MNDEIDPTAHTDIAVSRASRMIGVVAAVVLGMTIGVAVGDASTPGPCEPGPVTAPSSR